jgi:hypothetical protein
MCTVELNVTENKIIYVVQYCLYGEDLADSNET